MLKLQLSNGQIIEVEEGSTLLPLAQKLSDKYASPIVMGLYNGEECDLQRPLTADGTVDFVEVNNSVGMRVYVRTLLFMLIAATKKLYPDVHLEVRNSLGSALYCKDNSERKLTAEDIRSIEEYMHKMAERREPIKLLRLPKSEAIDMACAICSDDNLALLAQVPDDTVLTINLLEGVPGYLFGPMCPDAGYVPYFELLPYADGVIINYPDDGNWQVLPPFVDQPRLNDAYQEAEEWSAMIHCNTVGKLNKIIDLGYAEKIIQVAEALHEKKLANIADILASHHELKLVLIAGPSSSGKTTFSHRLSIQLAAHGMKPHPIAVDNYFVNREHTPLDEFGEKDYECLEAIDVEQFNKDMLALLNGERIELPVFNFKTGQREYKGDFLQLGKEDILVIEGIHGLNDKLSYALPKESKFKIYISALTQLNIDEHNRIPTTDGRLIRRIVRDARTRGTSASETIARWPSVRRGEEKNIFPYQEEADVMFNSALIYELACLKVYAEPLLFGISKEEPEYLEANRLLKFFDYFVAVPSEEVPNNSLLREFIGGSCFNT